MIKIISISIFAFMLMACSTPQVREDTTPVEIVEPPVEVLEILEPPVEVVDIVEELKLPDGVSTRDTERGEILVIDLSLVYFYNEKTTMYKGYEDIFSLTKEVLDMNPSVNIILEGHASKPGKAYPYNYNLSENRAKASLTYLESIAVNPDRLTTRGLGEGLPEYDTENKNRRLEFVIIKNQDDLNTYEDYVKNVDINKEMS